MAAVLARVRGRGVRAPCITLAAVATTCILFLAVGTWTGGGDIAGTENPLTAAATTQEETFDNFPHPTETLYQGLPYRYVGNLSYQVEGGSVARPVTLHESALLAHVRRMATVHVRNQLPKARFTDARYRWLPEGVEFDLTFRDPSSAESSRVTLYQPLQPPRVIHSRPVHPTTRVNVVVTLRGRVAKYDTFLEHLTTHVLPHDPHLALTVVYFTDRHLHHVRNITAHRLEPFKDFPWTLVEVNEEEFSRGRGLDAGAVETGSDMGDLLFFCDVDVLMHHDFFSRCRSNTVKGHQVYYPVVFSLYNPKLVYPLFDKTVPPVQEQLVVDEQSGFWRVFGYGMACMYRPDYAASGGFPDIRSWGGEDVALFEKFLKMKEIKVIRAPDPSLFHLYHAKECSDTSSVSYPACLKSKAVTEGSQLQLGLTLLKMSEGTDLEGVLSKRFYYFWLVPYLGCLLVVSLATNLIQALLLLNKRIRSYR